jgi:hypothetical protein
MRTKIQLNKAETISRRSASEEMNAIARKLPLPILVKCSHTPPVRFTPGSALELRLLISGVSSGDGGKSLRSVRLQYRHANQAERWNVLDLLAENGVYAAAIPPEYTRSEFGLEYYFELSDDRGVEWMYPGFNQTLSNQPYFAICKRNGPTQSE